MNRHADDNDNDNDDNDDDDADIIGGWIIVRRKIFNFVADKNFSLYSVLSWQVCIPKIKLISQSVQKLSHF